MSKAVMISIQPKWCELIASGKKTIEVRKTMPKLETPFKCYIYMTMNGLSSMIGVKTKQGFVMQETHKVYPNMANGRVIGEFVCDKINEFKVFENGAVQYWGYYDLEKSCLTYNQIAEYIGNNKKGYAWQISDLKIYDKPKELSEFKKHLNCGNYDCCVCHNWDRIDLKCIAMNNELTRPPQSWCYVEKLEVHNAE